MNFEIAFGENFIKCVSISTSAVYQRCICVLLIQQTGKYLFWNICIIKRTEGLLHKKFLVVFQFMFNNMYVSSTHMFCWIMSVWSGCCTNFAAPRYIITCFLTRFNELYALSWVGIPGIWIIVKFRTSISMIKFYDICWLVLVVHQHFYDIVWYSMLRFYDILGYSLVLCIILVHH